MSVDRISEIRVSTIIPVYNGAATIARAIDSALAQDFAAQEIIVVNDGSTDDTKGILDRYGDTIRTIHQSNRGLSLARNAGIAIARGEYIAFLDADDYWLQGHLSGCVAELDSDPCSVLCYSGFIPVENGVAMPPRVLINPPSLKELLDGEHSILPSTSVVRKSAALECGGFSERLNNCSFEDIYFCMLLAESGRFRTTARPLVVYSSHPFLEIGMKYSRGLRHFERLVSERYGTAATTAIAGARSGFVDSMIKYVIDRIEVGDSINALRGIWRLLRFDPGRFFRQVGFRNLLRLRNLKRAQTIVSRLAKPPRQQTSA
jgi:glycosyltransferase involved in cell wall biosynthesis